MNTNKKIYYIAGALALVMIIVVIVIVSSGNKSESIDLDAASKPYTLNPNSDPKPIGDGDYDYTEAIDHIGETATVTGTVNNIFTSKTGTIFFDYCESFQTCPFSAVIFASDASKFKDMESYKREIKVKGLVKSYQGKAEMIINDPKQIE